MKLNLFSILMLVLCLFLFTSVLFSQTHGRIVIGVMDLDASGLDADAQKAMSDRLRTELFNTGRFSVMERNKMSEILEEQGFQQTGCTSTECVVEIGALLGVDRMIAGSVGKVGNIYTVSLRMIDIETGRIMLSKTEDCSCPIEKVLTTSLRNVALKMAGLSSDSQTLPVLREESVAGSGDFYFKSSPEGATVFIDDEALEGVTPLMKENISAGTHQIRMKKGYYTGSQTVFLEPNEFKRIELTLSKVKGSLKIISIPLEADIYLDNKSVGNTPQTLTNLDAGEHRLKLTKPGYLNHEKIILIDGGEQKRMTITLEKMKPATLKIIPQISDCDVYINNQYKGKTPLTDYDLMPGYVQVKLVHPMHNDWQQSVILANGETKEINPSLIKKTGQIIVKSEPAGADVKLNGELKGKTPLTLSDIEYGKYIITISKKDYQLHTEDINLVSEDAKTVFSRLTLAKGVLSVSGIPSGSDIYLDSKSIGNLPLNHYEIEGGTYVLDVKAKGYEKYSETIVLSPNQTKNLNIELIQKTNSKAMLRSLFIPGLGQGYLEKKGKAALFPILEIGALAGVFIFNNQYNSAIDDYNSARDNYLSSAAQSKIDQYYSQMENSYDDMESAEQMRTIFIGAAVGIWLWNVADAALFGPEFDSNTQVSKNNYNRIEFMTASDSHKQLIGLNINF